mmetsp:Transcript_118427/g.330339  ORF Transcript_118427/g.330339 Transcript_118427/m.330339 type:complete len:228 (+) Transcript_118427:680-1363(+)
MQAALDGHGMVGEVSCRTTVLRIIDTNGHHAHRLPLPLPGTSLVDPRGRQELNKRSKGHFLRSDVPPVCERATLAIVVEGKVLIAFEAVDEVSWGGPRRVGLELSFELVRQELGIKQDPVLRVDRHRRVVGQGVEEARPVLALVDEVDLAQRARPPVLRSEPAPVGQRAARQQSGRCSCRSQGGQCSPLGPAAPAAGALAYIVAGVHGEQHGGGAAGLRAPLPSDAR